MIMPSDNSWLDAEFDRALDGAVQTAQTIQSETTRISQEIFSLYK